MLVVVAATLSSMSYFFADPHPLHMDIKHDPTYMNPVIHHIPELYKNSLCYGMIYYDHNIASISKRHLYGHVDRNSE
jgi:hypothetical protein